MANRSQYFRIGLFVLVAAVLLVGALVVLTAGSLYRKTVKAETYFRESIQGVEVGSPVKYRGVPIGAVTSIHFTTERYSHDQYRYVLVLMNLWPDSIGTRTMSFLRDKGELRRWIDRGLRIQIRQQGFTGTAYLEVDEFEPEAYEPIPIAWIPEHIYIPSAPSTITRVTESIDVISNTLQGLDQADLGTIATNLDRLVTAVTTMVQTSKLEVEATALLGELRTTNERLGKLIARPELDAIMADAAETLQRARRVMSNVDERQGEILSGFTNAALSLDNLAQQINELVGSDEFRRGVQNLSEASQKANDALQDAPQAVEGVREAVARVDRLLERHEHDMATILTNLSAVTENLRQLTEDARRHPAYTLFGEPPPRMEPHKR